MTRTNKTLLAIAAAMGTIVSANAATTLISDDFESSLGNWTASSGTSLYAWGGLPDHNYASGGSGAANLPKNGGTLALTDALSLDTQGYTSVTISFDYQRQNASTTRHLRIEYAADGINFTTLASKATGNNENIFSASVTLLEGTDHTVSGDMNLLNGSFLPSFTDTAKFRFVDVSSAGADVRSYVDNITITGTPDFVPEPNTTALLGLGGLALILRRRK